MFLILFQQINLFSKYNLMKEEFKITYNIRQKLILAIFLPLGYGSITYFINPDLSFKNIAIQAIIWGVFMFLFFLFLFPKIMKRLVGKPMNKIKPSLKTDETIEEEIFANLFRGIEGVGGKLYFTNYGLIFVSHSFNIQRGQTNINFSDIIGVERSKTMKIVDNGIKLATKEQKEYLFVVNNRDVVIEKIKNSISQ